MRVKIDRDFYKPVYQDSWGYVSVTIGDHKILAGTYNFKWPDGHHEALRVKMEGKSSAVSEQGQLHPTIVHTEVPYAEIVHHGSKFLVPVHETGAEVARIK